MSVGTKEVAGLKCRCLIYLVIECLARVTFVPVCHVSNAEEEGEEVEDTNRRIDYRVRRRRTIEFDFELELQLEEFLN